MNTSSVETHDGYFFCFSSDILPGKSEREHAGVGIVVHTRFKPYLYEVKQTSGRVMAIRLRSMGTNVAFLCCYAPHSGHGVEVKEAFYDSIQELLTECAEAVYIGGDFNTRLQYKYENESEVLGPHIFGRGRDYLERVAMATRESRDLFMDFCTANSLRVLNTDFQKSAEKQATFRENTTPLGCTQYTAENYAQLDFF